MPSPPPSEVQALYDRPPTWWQRHVNETWAVVVALVTVVLAVVSFPPFKGAEFAYVIAAPGILWAYRAPRFRLFAGTMLGAQTVVWIVLLSWLHYVTWGGLLLLGLFLGALTGSWYAAAWWTVIRIKQHPAMIRIAALLGLAGLWVLIEWVRTWIFGGFPWLPLAASQWERPLLLQIASYTGAWGVSFILIYFCLGMSAYADRLLTSPVRGLRRRSPEFMVALSLLMFPSFLLIQEGFGQKREELGRFALVQPDIPQTVKWDPSEAQGIMATVESLTLSAAAERPGIIVGPESVMPWALKLDPNVQPWLESLADRARVPLMLGVEMVEHPGEKDEAWFNSAAVVEPKTGLQPHTYAKRKLVPFGEYVPLRPVLGWLNKFVPIGDGDFQRGTRASPFVVQVGSRIVKLGAMICYEDIFPSLARDSASTGVDALVVLTNNGWFGEGGAAYQHAAHSVLRAVETRRPVIRVGNAGWSGWIDEFGYVRATMTNDAGTIYFRGAKIVNVTRDTRWAGRDSFYVAHGDWFLFVCAIVAIFAFLLLRSAPKGTVGKSGEASPTT